MMITIIMAIKIIIVITISIITAIAPPLIADVAKKIALFAQKKSSQTLNIKYFYTSVIQL